MTEPLSPYDKFMTVIITCSLIGGMLAFLFSAAFAATLFAEYMGWSPIQ